MHWLLVIIFVVASGGGVVEGDTYFQRADCVDAASYINAGHYAPGATAYCIPIKVN